MTSLRIAILAVVAMLCVFQRANAAGDPVAGKTAYQNQCSVCHTTVADKNGFGPSLAAVMGRRSGALKTFKYSSAMTSAAMVWNPNTLDAFLASSTIAMPGTVMQVAIADKIVRANVIAYLGTLGNASSVRADHGGSVVAKLMDGPSVDELRNAASDTKNWLHASKDYQGQRFVGASQITAANASRLRPTCIYRSDNIVSMQTSPLVYNGIMYITMDEVTVAIDATSCRQVWSYTWALNDGVLSKVNRGVAIQGGRLLRGTPDGYLIALNMADGSLLWSRKIADSRASQYLSMPPLIFEDAVVFGPAGADWGAKNWVGAFDLKTGQERWRFNLVPNAGEPGAETWRNPKAREHGGGSLWTPLSLDVAKGILYLPVGNPSPDFYEAVRPGDNLYTNSAVALDVRNGKLLWFHQFGPADAHDRDLSQVSPLFSAPVGGKTRDLIAISGKDGLLRVLDRDTHAQLYERVITTRTDSEVSPTVEGAHSCPGLLGGMEWNGPAYIPSTHTLFVATVDWCATFTRTAQVPTFESNAHYYGGAADPDAREKARGWIRALDGPTGKELWKRQWPTPLVAGVTATAGGVLFSGDLDDNFFVLDALSGKTLYTFNTGGTVGGGVISYEANGKQYVAATSGVVSGFFGGHGTAAIIVFSL